MEVKHELRREDRNAVRQVSGKGREERDVVQERHAGLILCLVRVQHASLYSDAPTALCNSKDY